MKTTISFFLALSFLFPDLSAQERSSQEIDSSVTAVIDTESNNALLKKVDSLEGQNEFLREMVGKLDEQVRLQKTDSTSPLPVYMYTVLAIALLMGVLIMYNWQNRKILHRILDNVKSGATQIDEEGKVGAKRVENLSAKPTFNKNRDVKEQIDRQSLIGRDNLLMVSEKAPQSDPGAILDPYGIIIIADPRSFTANIIQFLQAGDEIAMRACQQAKDQKRDPFSAEALIVANMLQNYLEKRYKPNQVRWRHIIDELSRGFVSDDNLVKNIREIKGEEQKLLWLEKPFYHEFLKSYINSILILLEELRNLKYFIPKERRSEIANYDIFSARYQELINEFLTKAEAILQLKIHYVPMCVKLDGVYAKLANATDKATITPYYQEIADITREQSETFIIEIESFGTDSRYENQKTIVKV